ncbi:MAG: hypothetical protein BWX61_01341 [Bacteroidetes bacterium ADurb.Bin035]|nr:MAG: hypothetical protein BWX61_01341 [Bacteroidetes bacterium ADurb.Bin035]
MQPGAGAVNSNIDVPSNGLNLTSLFEAASITHIYLPSYAMSCGLLKGSVVVCNILPVAVSIIYNWPAKNSSPLGIPPLSSTAHKCLPSHAKPVIQ